MLSSYLSNFNPRLGSRLLLVTLFLSGILAVAFLDKYTHTIEEAVLEEAVLEKVLQEEIQQEKVLQEEALLEEQETQLVEQHEAYQKESLQAESDFQIAVDPIYWSDVPNFSHLSSEHRKQQFVAFMLPMILHVNDELLELRELVDQAADQENLAELLKLAKRYRYKFNTTNIETLRDDIKHRINIVPVSIALAQAAIESGWGTSRFAIDGNALFGQWAWSKDAGIQPAEGQFENVVVRSFNSPLESVRAYMHNLNSHPAYGSFRNVRASKPYDIQAMVNTLELYSQERQIYTEKLFQLILTNDFKDYDEAILASR